ncbi:hypothetical protein [Falsiroseomonas oryziterrae]|uniref:hypothetical protein n=1 Tax=Falsiroseomonas oryziterrae TaxID=2911368 RepID=UPI001F1BBD60|nr:hypothetical protein [Roseomonas sp. NPKOSM-4]
MLTLGMPNLDFLALHPPITSQALETLAIGAVGAVAGLYIRELTSAARGVLLRGHLSTDRPDHSDVKRFRYWRREKRSAVRWVRSEREYRRAAANRTA